jgi:competence ComEA-like helix-hairpin-helix protein
MNSTGTDTGKKDLRPLALLLFALAILSVAAVRLGWLPILSRQEVPAPQKLAWCDGSVATGLYRVPADAAYPVAEEQPQVEAAPGQKANAPKPPPAKLAPLFFKPIPINQADEELLVTIPGIGPAFARRIIEFREQHGRINTIEELDAVNGVGPAKLKILKAHLVVD